MSKKNICIVGWNLGENSFGVTKSYLEYFSKYGDVHIITPNNFDKIYRCDLLVLPGGKDVDPRRYNRKPSFWTGAPDPHLEWFDYKALPKYIEKNIPIFGICRGFQSICVYYGVPMDQHVSGWHDSSTKHRGELTNDLFNPERYNINTLEISGKRDNKGNPVPDLKVNSLHHQAILYRDLLNNTDLLKAAYICEDEVVEAVYHVTKPIIGVQFHPEEINDSFSDTSIKRLLEWPKSKI